MRQIKFRCWNPELKRFEERFEIGPYGSVGFTNMFETYEDQPNWILQQYTGIEDKEGIEIYEGDIIKDESFIYEVGFGEFYYEDCWFSGWIVRRNKVADFGFSYLDGKEVKIIGNIYQNPELLNPKQQ